MPLSCDCYGGCWGDHSKDWPSATIPEELIEAERKRGVHYPDVAATTRLVNAAKIPYGSYVGIGEDVLRVENSAYLAQLVDAINAATRKPNPLTFAAVREAQLSRTARWHKGEATKWPAERYLLASEGEAGEMGGELLSLLFFVAARNKTGEIANAVKKLWRIEQGIANRSTNPHRQLSTREEVLAFVKKEAADWFLYLDLALADLDLDLAEAIREVFNAKSEENGFPERL